MENFQMRKMAKDLLPGSNAVKAYFMSYWPIIAFIVYFFISQIISIFRIYQFTKNDFAMIALEYMIKSPVVLIGFNGIAILLQVILLVTGWADKLFIYEYLRTKELKITNYFKHYDNFKNVVVTYILVNLYTFLWSLLFVIPGIVMSYSYRLAPYIMRDSEYKVSYKEAITLSSNMMSGNKLRLFCLEFGYFFHFIFACITFGVYLIWLMPRVNLSRSIFYETVKSEYQIKN